MVKGKNKEKSEKVKYDAATTVKCPKCDEDIQVGTAGPAGIVQHQGKKPCQKARQAKKDKGKLRTLFQVGVKKVQALLPGTASTSLAESSSQSQQPQREIQNRGCELGRKLIAELKRAAEQMGREVPIATESDEISAFRLARAETECAGVANDEIWEVVNPGLDRLLGFRRPMGDVESMIVRRGDMGVDGFCQYLTYLVEEKGVVGGLIEGKVKVLISAINNISLRANLLPSTEPNAMGQSSTETGMIQDGPIDVDCIEDARSHALIIATSHRGSQNADDPPKKQACVGVLIELPSGISPYSVYPFKLHDIFSLAWDIRIANYKLWLTSTNCTGEVACDACRPCRELLLNNIVSGILNRIEHGVHENTPLAFRSIESLIELIRRKTQSLDSLRFTKLAMARKLVARAKTLDTYKKFVMALGDSQVNRVDALIRAGLKRGAGIHGMLDLLDRANKGLYKPKNFTEEELLRGLLFLRLGGARVADLAHRSLDHPGESTLRRSTAVTSLSPSAGMPTQTEIRTNIQAIFQGTDLSKNHGYVLMIDEIKLEERPRWDDKTNKITGLCREHTGHLDLEFCSIEVAKGILRSILNREIHWASEATVFSFGILSGERQAYGSRPFVISGTCKREKADPHAELIDNVIKVCDGEAAIIGPPLFCVASDGESRRGSALMILTHKRPLSPSSPIFSLLSNLRLLNLYVGDHDLTADKDYKHVVKRLRNLLLRKMGAMVNGVHITPALLRFHLNRNKVTTHRLDYLLNPHDRQNVPLCYSLLREVWSLPDPSPSDKPGFVAARRALQLLGSLFRHIVVPFIQINLSLHDQLVHLSAAAHLATFLYTVNRAKNKALQSLTFRDIILLVKNAYFCVAKTKVKAPDGKFWIILLGTDRLESTFGLVRSMVGTDKNADILQLGTRLSHAVECLNIFEKHPEWDRGPKRLKLPAIQDGNGDVLAKVDHINPSSWKGDVRVANVSLATSWNTGRETAESEFPSHGIADLFLGLDRNGYDMAAPFGCDLEEDTDDEDADTGNLNEVEDAVDILANSSSQVPVLGVGEGPLLDLEDHAAIEENRNGKGKFDPFVDVDGKKVSKPRALRELFKAMISSLPGSTDRLGRVAGLTRFTVKEPSATDTILTSNIPSDLILDGPSLFVGDPVATLLRCEGKIFLGIVQVNEINVDHLSVLEIRPELLVEPIVSIQFQIYRLVEITDTNDADYDDANWKWNRKLEKDILKTKGSCIQVIDPAVSTRVPFEPIYLFKTDELRGIAASLFGSISPELRGRIPTLKRSDFFPYRSQNKAAFICESEGLDQGLLDPESDCCPQCRPSFTWDRQNTHKVLEHIGAHLLFDTSLDTSLELCGLCFRPSPLCVFYLRKGKGVGASQQVDLQKSRCPNLIKAFSYQSASVETTSSPCSNVPLNCPLCPSTSGAIWKYNMPAHFKNCHPSALQASYSTMFTISGSERAGLEIVWGKRHAKKRRKKGAAKTKNQLIISEAHSTRQVFSNQDASTEPHELDTGLSDTEEHRQSESDSTDSDSEATDSDSDKEPEMDEEHEMDIIPEITSQIDVLQQPEMATGTSVQPEEQPAAPTLSPTLDSPSSEPRPVVLLATNQTEFTVNAVPTRRGRPRRTRDMADMYACICGTAVEDDARVIGSNTAIRCGFNGCETLWFHLECLNFEVAPSGWRCENHVRTRKRTRLA